jgi:hypothetical protein
MPAGRCIGSTATPLAAASIHRGTHVIAAGGLLLLGGLLLRVEPEFFSWGACPTTNCEMKNSVRSCALVAASAL